MTKRARRRSINLAIVTHWCVILMALIGGGCSRTPSVVGDQAAAPADAVKIDDVHVSTTDSGFIVQYRTRTSAADCRAQAAEMPKVWNQVVKPRLKESAPQRVVLFPEDPTSQSVSFGFIKGASGQWVAKAPCSITIPAG